MEKRKLTCTQQRSMNDNICYDNMLLVRIFIESLFTDYQKVPYMDLHTCRKVSMIL